MDRMKTMNRDEELSKYGGWLMGFRNKLATRDTIKTMYRPQALSTDPNDLEGVEFASEDMLRMRVYMTTCRCPMDYWFGPPDNIKTLRMAVREWEMLGWYQEARLVKDSKIGEKITKEMVEQHLASLWEMANSAI